MEVSKDPKDYGAFADRFIGEKKILFAELTDETTPAGTKLVKVTFADDSVEHFSELMFGYIVSDEQSDLSALREKRIKPIVQAILELLREYGIRVGELPYFSALLNQSLDFNRAEAERHLWSRYMPKPKDLEDVDLITVDRVLREYGEQNKANASE